LADRTTTRRRATNDRAAESRQLRPRDTPQRRAIAEQVARLGRSFTARELYESLRYEWQALNPFSWFPALLAMAALLVALALPRPGLRTATTTAPVDDDASFARPRGGT